MPSRNAPRTRNPHVELRCIIAHLHVGGTSSFASRGTAACTAVLELPSGEAALAEKARDTIDYVGDETRS